MWAKLYILQVWEQGAYDYARQLTLVFGTFLTHSPGKVTKILVIRIVLFISAVGLESSPKFYKELLATVKKSMQLVFCQHLYKPGSL